MCSNKTSITESCESILHSDVVSSYQEASYPEEFLKISFSNARVCKYFDEAVEAFANNKFLIAHRLMENYRKNVQYKEFYIHDNRIYTAPLLSVIIVAYNTKQDLIKCIRSVLQGNLKEIEIIVVDNGKNAEVLPLLLGMPILYIKAPMNLILSEGRNIGVSFAKSPLGAFVDDDGLVDSHFCAQALLPFNDPQILAIRGKVLPKTKNAMQSTSWHYDFGPDPIFSQINTEGCSVWRLKEYRECEGLDPLLFGHEGTDLTIRYTLRYGFGKTLYWPKLVLFHDYAVTSTKMTVKDKRHQQMFEYVAWKTPQAYAIVSLYDQAREHALGIAQEKNPVIPPPIPHKKKKKTFEGQAKSVCFFIPSLGSGGAERQVVYLAKALADEGFRVHILCLQLENERGHFRELLQNTAITCRTINEKDLAWGQAYAEHNPDRFHSIFTLRMDHKIVLALAGALLEIQPDILHCYLDDASCFGGCAGLAVDLPGIVLSARSSPPSSIPDYRDMTVWTPPVYQFLLQHNSIVMEANSSTGARDYEAWLSLPVNSIRINNNGFDKHSFTIAEGKNRESVRTSLGISASSPTIIWVGKYNSVKNPEDMVAIAKQVKETNPNVRFLAVGNLLEREVESQVLLKANNMQDTVMFLGPRHDVQDLLHASDVFLLTSTIEGFPNAVMEAMACGLPVVSTNVGAVPEMVSADTGFVYDAGDVSGMAKSIVRLLASPTLCQKMGVAGRERTRKLFTMDNLIKRTLSTYHDVIRKQEAGFCPTNS